VRFELVQRVQAPLDVVEAAYIDPEFLIELGKLPKLGHPELLEQRDRGTEVWQRLRYAFRGHLSAAVTAVVDPNQLSWVEESTLDRATHRTTFRIVPDHYGRMLEASGQVTLTEDQGGAATTRRTTGDLSVHVPFVGHKVETAIIAGLREHAELEVGVLERWAGEHR
jgi:Protein of unknown function (DUF2505)